METSRESKQSAPEVFDEYFKPSELAEYFKQYAQEMVDEGYAIVQDSSVAPRDGRGLEISFNEEGAVESVLLRDSNDPELITHQIQFTPPNEHMDRGIIDGSTAVFSMVEFSDDGHTFKKTPLWRQHLRDGDRYINEFFRDLADAIDPDNLRNG